MMVTVPDRSMNVSRFVCLSSSSTKKGFLSFQMLMSVCCLLLSQAACSAALTLLGATTANVHPATANKPQMATAKVYQQ